MSRLGLLRVAGFVLLFLAAALLSPTPAKSQEPIDLQAQAEALFQSLTVPERIGQLFLVTFEGDRAPDRQRGG